MTEITIPHGTRVRIKAAGFDVDGFTGEITGKTFTAPGVSIWIITLDRPMPSGYTCIALAESMFTEIG